MRNSNVNNNNKETSSPFSASPVVVSSPTTTNNNSNAPTPPIPAPAPTTTTTSTNNNNSSNSTTSPTTSSSLKNQNLVVLRCVICRKPVEIASNLTTTTGTGNNKKLNQNNIHNSNVANSTPALSSSSSSSLFNAVSAANLLYSCAVTTSQDFPLCQTCWQHRHITTQQTTLSELSSLVETLNSVENVNPIAIAVFQGASLEIDPCSREYIAVGGVLSSHHHHHKTNDGDDGEKRKLFSNSHHDDDEHNQEIEEESEEFIKEKEKLLAELAEIEKKLLSKRGEVLSLQEDLTVFSQEVDGIERKQNGLVNQESAVKSAAQSAASRLHKAKSGFARLGLSSTEGIGAMLDNQNQNQNVGAVATDKNSSSSSSQQQQIQQQQQATLFISSAVGSCLGVAYQLDVDDTIPRINGRRVGRLPQSLTVPDEEINCGCGFLSLLMHHFLQSYTKMERTGCSMEPLGSQSTITVFVPKKVTVDFHIKRKLFSWSTFGQAWVVFANCTNEVVLAMTQGLRTKAQKLRASNSTSSSLITRIDDHITTAQSSLPKITAATGNPAAKVDDNNVKYGDASDTMWTAAVHGLFRCLKWCIEAEKYLAE